MCEDTLFISFRKIFQKNINIPRTFYTRPTGHWHRPRRCVRIQKLIFTMRLRAKPYGSRQLPEKAALRCKMARMPQRTGPYRAGKRPASQRPVTQHVAQRRPFGNNILQERPAGQCCPAGRLHGKAHGLFHDFNHGLYALYLLTGDHGKHMGHLLAAYGGVGVTLSHIDASYL